MDVMEEDNQVNIGDYVAVCDNCNDTRYASTFHVAKVLNIEDEIYSVWYMSTIARRMHTAKWKFVYAERTGRYSNRVPTHIDRLNSRLTGKIDEDNILMGNLQLNKNYQIRKKCIDKLRKLGLTHHRLGTTWAN